MKTFGSRAEVFHGNAKKTRYGLTKEGLIKNKHGEIVSRKKSIAAKKEMRLEKHGYFTKKGVFGYVKKDTKSKSHSKTKSKKSKAKSRKRVRKA
jgi:hypothetical protein